MELALRVSFMILTFCFSQRLLLFSSIRPINFQLGPQGMGICQTYRTLDKLIQFQYLILRVLDIQLPYLTEAHRKDQ